MIRRIKHSLIGIPDHQGVFNVGGRIGAALGPKFFREVWSRFQIHPEDRKFFDDCGDLVCSSEESLEQYHQRISEWVAEQIIDKKRVVLVGGGHDFAAPLVQGAKSGSKSKNIGCINLDAHFDLREKKEGKITSGSPFRILIETGTLKPLHLIEFGIQKQSNHASLCDYAEKQKIKTLWIDQLRNKNVLKLFQNEMKKLMKSCDEIIVSVDLDVFPQSEAPGVSAPQTEGLRVEDVIEMLQWASAQPKVIALGIFELNPLHDVETITARLAATLVHRFVFK